MINGETKNSAEVPTPGETSLKEEEVTPEKTAEAAKKVNKAVEEVAEEEKKTESSEERKWLDKVRDGLKEFGIKSGKIGLGFLKVLGVFTISLILVALKIAEKTLSLARAATTAELEGLPKAIVNEIKSWFLSQEEKK